MPQLMAIQPQGRRIPHISLRPVALLYAATKLNYSSNAYYTITYIIYYKQAHLISFNFNKECFIAFFH